MADLVPVPDDSPPATDPPPWGRSLVREYRLVLEQWQALNNLDRPGLPAEDRERLEAEKVKAFERAAVARAHAVNELLLLVRWAREDAPGALEVALAGLDIPALMSKLRPAVDAEVERRVAERLGPVREAYTALLDRVRKLEQAGGGNRPPAERVRPPQPVLARGK